MPKRITTEEFIKKAKKVHGDKYDYSKVKYTNSQTKVCIICPIHGEFWQLPYSHMKGFGCKKCCCEKISHKLSSNTQEFIKKARKVHGDKYDYSKVEYINNSTKVCIICPEHGEFWQSPNNHLSKKQNCPKCGLEHLSKIKSLNMQEFIKKAKEIHGDKYDYSKVKYINSKTKVCIICPEHGEFWQTPLSHITGRGCRKCGFINSKRKQSLSNEEFIERAKEIHGDKYDYSKVKYVNTRQKVTIICFKHGDFKQEPRAHLQGQGCPKCNQSHLEEEINSFLIKSKIKFIYQANKKDLKWLGKQSLDFYLPDYNAAIECQGEQHFKNTSFGSKNDKLIIKKAKDIKKRDVIKYNKCIENNLRLFYYTHYDINDFMGNKIFKDKEELLKEIII